jgi:hypothetical protein
MMPGSSKIEVEALHVIEMQGREAQQVVLNLRLIGLSVHTLLLLLLIITTAIIITEQKYAWI